MRITNLLRSVLLAAVVIIAFVGCTANAAETDSSRVEQIEQGNLVSWGWLQHNVGGQYRRLLAYTASDHKQMLRTRNAIYDELYDRRMRRVTLEFDDICPSHEDYMWDVQIETP